MTIRYGKPDGYTTLTPFLVCSRAARADRLVPRGVRLLPGQPHGPPGRNRAARLLDLGEGRLQLGDPAEYHGLVAPTDHVRHRRLVRVDLRPVRGHRWAVMTRAEDVSPEDAERRLAGRAAAQS